tara:strand:+ start:253 stop:1470 length:1218 start_codon:yes stop_codon:yes gene_type:complete
MGVVSSLGETVGEFWGNVSAGKSGLASLKRFDSTGYNSTVAAEVSEEVITRLVDPKMIKRNDRYTLFALIAARQAVADSGIEVTDENRKRCGVLIGSGIGGMETIEKQARILAERGPRKISPFMIPSIISNIAGGIVAIDTGARGPNFAIVSACATGTHTIGESYKILQNGEADVMIAGGTEAAITGLGFAGFCSMKAMSSHYNDAPETASRPFDKNRDGFVMGEGAGVLVMETLGNAQARGANIIAEVTGYATTCDAYHITSPDPECGGLAECFRLVLENSGKTPEDISYINAHGTSTQFNDKFETKAIKEVFGKEAYNTPVSSTKSMTGHLLGAAGAIEAVICCKAIETNIAPPTINYETPDEDCDLDYIPNVKREMEINSCLSNNSGFGGHNASLIFDRFKA